MVRRQFARLVRIRTLILATFDYRQAEEIRDVFSRHDIHYLFLGTSGAILLGYPDTTQEVELFIEKSPQNGRALVAALIEVAFTFTETMQAETERGKDFVQMKDGPFDLDLIFAPDGIERFEDAWKRRVEVEGFPVCSIDDIIASKIAANRQKDRESLARLQSFRDYLNQQRKTSSSATETNFQK